MRDIVRRRSDCLCRSVQFYLDNAVDVIGITKTKFQALEAKVNQADTNSGLVEANKGEGAGATDQEDTVRENLGDKCSAISETAKGMEPDFDGISATFRFKRSLNEADLLARAMGMALAAVPFEANFIDYNLPASFLADLNSEVAAFETAINTQSTQVGDRVEAHASLAAAISEGMILKRTLNPMVKNLYNGNPGKIAAWASASHVEAAPKPKPKPPMP